ncbi:unnamed protein product, partial [Medioppia subpectinata]
FFRGLGYILGPIIVEPFLTTEVVEDDSVTTVASINGTKTVDSIVLFAINGTQSPEPKEEAHIYIPYMINGVMLILAAVLVFIQYLFCVRLNRLTKMTVSSSQDTIISTITCDDKVSQTIDIEKYENETKREEPKLYTLSIIILCSVFYLFFFEEVVVTYLASFSANIDLHLTKSGGAFLTSIFNVCNVIGKGIGIVLALKLKHFTMLYMNLIVCGVLNMSGTLGSVFVPLAIANYIESYPLSLIYASLLCALSCLIVLIAIQMLIVFRQKRLKRRQLIQEKPVVKC